MSDLIYVLLVAHFIGDFPKPRLACGYRRQTAKKQVGTQIKSVVLEDIKKR